MQEQSLRSSGEQNPHRPKPSCPETRENRLLNEARFGLLPGFATEVKYGTRTYNARSESIAQLASFKNAWAKARHCIVPCEAIYEPDWRTGTHIPTRFTAAKGGTLGVAGLWQRWKSPEGDWINILNADDHAPMKHMHRPDPKRPRDMQDKRMVVILPEGAPRRLARCAGIRVQGLHAAVTGRPAACEAGAFTAKKGRGARAALVDLTTLLSASWI